MAHKEQQNFLLSVKQQFPERFKNCSVLDIGSLDINGNNRYLFEDYSYIGLDIGEGKNVDIVCRGHEYKSDKQFDIVISTECFEHDEYWNLTIENAIRLTKPNGLFLFTCATTGRPEHGTKRAHAFTSPFTSQLENDYYMNLTEFDIRSKIDIDNFFDSYNFISQTKQFPEDLYFWGLKKNINENKDCNEVVTGIVVTFNTKDVFEDTYNAFRVAHPNMNVIVVDNSTESSCIEYVKSLENEKTKIIYAEKDTGHGKGLHLGIENANTPYVLTFDSDAKILKSPIQGMLDMMEDDTYGVGYFHTTAIDGHDWGFFLDHKNQPKIKYLHPYFSLIQVKEYKKYQPFIHHGAPAASTMNDIYLRGLSDKVLKEFKGLGHSSAEWYSRDGKELLWKGEPREFVEHHIGTTRAHRKKNEGREMDFRWEQPFWK